MSLNIIVKEKGIIVIPSGMNAAVFAIVITQ
jgi:hypothetical protein